MDLKLCFVDLDWIVVIYSNDIWILNFVIREEWRIIYVYNEIVNMEEDFILVGIVIFVF